MTISCDHVICPRSGRWRFDRLIVGKASARRRFLKVFPSGRWRSGRDYVGFSSGMSRSVGKQSTRIGKVTMFTSASSRPRHVGPTGGRRCINTRRPTLLCRFVVDGPTSFWRQIVIGPASSRCLFVTWVTTMHNYLLQIFRLKVGV